MAKKARGKHAKGKAASVTETPQESVLGTEDQPEQEISELPAETDAAEDEVAGADGEADESKQEDAGSADLTTDAAEYPLVDDAAVAGAFSAAALEAPSKKRRRALKAFGITAGILIGIVLIAYIAGAIVFMGRFLPNTSIADQDISMKTDAEVVEILDKMADDYQLDVVCGGFTYRTTGKDISLKCDSEGIVKSMHADLNAWTWPALLLQNSHDESAQLDVTYDHAALSKDFTEKIDSFNATATPPTNATIAYDEASKSFQVKPEQIGTQIDATAAMRAVDQAVPALQPKLTMGDDQLVQPTVFSTDEKLAESAKVASGLVSANVKLKMGDKVVGEVNGQSLSGFVSINENLEVKFDEEGLNAWVEALADGFNTKGTERHYTRADGKQINVGGGEYGWEVDTEELMNAILEAIKTGQETTVEVPCYETAEVYNGPGQRDWGNRYIDVDLSEQYVRFYGDDGSIIWESDCISGAPDGEHDTKLGVWYINNKESPSKLIGYERGKKIYETTVNYWMAFEGSGIGLHDATWQPSFGGSMYANGYGSHGCVNLPYDAAQELYNISQIGDVVIVHW